MRVAVTGSRTWTNEGTVKRSLLRMQDSMDLTLLVGYNEQTRQPKGLDRIAFTLAKAHSISVLSFHADWENNGVGAGMIRNEAMIAEADYVVGYWDGKSSGTANALYHGLLRDIVARVYLTDGRVIEDMSYLFANAKSERAYLPPLDPLVLGDALVERYLEKVGYQRYEDLWSSGQTNPLPASVAYMHHIKGCPDLNTITEMFSELSTT